MPEVQLMRIVLLAARDRLPALQAFYGGLLGLENSADRYRAGASEFAFEPARGRPFYHFAMLVPGNRFAAALAWAEARVELLPDSVSGETTRYFEDWAAHACYFHDPAGNIVELIAHRGVGDSAATGAFAGAELIQLSEIGLVGDRAVLLADLAGLGIDAAQGGVEEPDGLAFLGPPTSSVIVSPAGRGWLPQGRPAELHPVELVLCGPVDAELTSGSHRVRQVSVAA